MYQLKNKTVTGLNAFERIIDNVRKVEPNFARVSYIKGNTPMGIEGDITDLSTENMSSGNLRVIQLVSAAKNPEHEKAFVIHIEEPESHFHPSLQRSVVREVLKNCREENIAVIIETHSPQVLRELYDNNVPIYRFKTIQNKGSGGPRRSEVSMLPRTREASEFLSEMGIDAGFALLGGVTIIVDGVTDPPAYRHWFSLFTELKDLLYCFVPIGCLEAKGLDLSGLSGLSAKTILIADGHYIVEHGDRAKEKCKEAGIEYFQLDHWGAENFISEQGFREAAKEIPGLTVAEGASFSPMKAIKDSGVLGFSKNHHMAKSVKHVTKEELEAKPDFMRIIQYLRSHTQNP